MSENTNGKFRHRRVNFAPVSNFALQDCRLSLKAKGMYALIQSLISKPNYDLYKWSLIKLCKEGEKAFDNAWRELKDTGYLKIYRVPSGDNDKFEYEYELLDEADESTPSLINLNKKREIVPQKAKRSEEQADENSKISHTPQKGVYANSAENQEINDGSHTPPFAPYADGTLCEEHPMPKGGSIRNTEPRNTDLRNIKSVCLLDTDGQTDEIRERLKAQIEYDYFEENLPDDLPTVDSVIDYLVEIQAARSTKINGISQSSEALSKYISQIDCQTIIEFMEHMRGKKLRDIKNIAAYWRSCLINFLREREAQKMTV